MPLEEIDPVNRAMADELVARYKGKRLNQAQLVEATGINATTMQRIMAGKSAVYVAQLFSLARALETSPEAIVEGAVRRLGDEA
ncbi:helix-turn-helix protein [Rathayibacter sp. PhB127]|uniref:helix-turn-helix domain-containing protein n=1 Tax=Rathayibacter sp. PhB127 TaxID=2485176 RepID=UPI000F4B712C|nr:helix-turn-helix transcriptional regulator [Rathayibacter sp. PhB127]ROS28871.1 helix-turn-helix protein [Rathayibacter sp. PhB127]